MKNQSMYYYLPKNIFSCFVFFNYFIFPFPIGLLMHNSLHSNIAHNHYTSMDTFIRTQGIKLNLIVRT